MKDRVTELGELVPHEVVRNSAGCGEVGAGRGPWFYEFILFWDFALRINLKLNGGLGNGILPLNI